MPPSVGDDSPDAAGQRLARTEDLLLHPPLGEVHRLIQAGARQVGDQRIFIGEGAQEPRRGGEEHEGVRRERRGDLGRSSIGINVDGESFVAQRQRCDHREVAGFSRVATGRRWRAHLPVKSSRMTRRLRLQRSAPPIVRGDHQPPVQPGKAGALTPCA
jgi:hypothetical protein